MWEWMFPSPPTPKEQLREHKKALRKDCRILKREQQKLEKNEPQLLKEIKQSAQDGKMKIAKIQTKNLIRCKKQIEKLMEMQISLQTTESQLGTMSSIAAMSQAMKGAAKIMYMMSRQVDLKQMQKIMMIYEKESEKMEMKQEFMDDTINGISDTDDDDKLVNDTLNQIMDEVSVKNMSKMDELPVVKVSNTIPKNLADRIDKLKKN